MSNANIKSRGNDPNFNHLGKEPNMSLKLVHQQHHLVDAAYKLSLIEKRLVLFSITKMQQENPERTIKFHVKDFLDVFRGKSSTIVYAQLKEAIDKLADRWVYTEHPTFIRKFRWVSSVDYDKTKAYISVSFTPEIMPYLSKEHTPFLAYAISDTATFKSVHSIRLYEMICKYRDSGWYQVSLEKLKYTLQLQNEYPLYKEFNRRVIQKSVDEINKKSPLLVTVEPIKEGRTVTALKFHIAEKKGALGHTEKTTKTGRKALPKRPNVRVGSDEEGRWADKCIGILLDWKNELKLRGEKLPTSDLMLLRSYYKIKGDTLEIEAIDRALKKREEQNKTA